MSIRKNVKLVLSLLGLTVIWGYCGNLLVNGFSTGEITGGRPFYNTYRLATNPSEYWFNMGFVGFLFIIMTLLLAAGLFKVTKGSPALNKDNGAAAGKNSCDKT